MRPKAVVASDVEKEGEWKHNCISAPSRYAYVSYGSLDIFSRGDRRSCTWQTVDCDGDVPLCMRSTMERACDTTYV